MVETAFPQPRVRMAWLYVRVYISTDRMCVAPADICAYLPETQKLLIF